MEANTPIFPARVDPLDADSTSPMSPSGKVIVSPRLASPDIAGRSAIIATSASTKPATPTHAGGGRRSSVGEEVGMKYLSRTR